MCVSVCVVMGGGGLPIGEVIVRSMLIMQVSGSLVLGECEKSFYRQHDALQGIGICRWVGMLAKSEV